MLVRANAQFMTQAVEEPKPYQTPSTVAWKRVPDPQSVQ